MGAVVPLGHRAIELLCALVAAKGTLVTKDELLRLVWPGLTVEENNLQVQISAVRKALQSGDEAQGYVVTVPGRGYRFIGLPSQDEAEAGGAARDKPSIVVLPFDNLSGDPEQRYFSDGIADDIAADLSKVSGLLVIAHNSALTYRGRAVKVQEISRELGIRYVLQGAGSLRISPELPPSRRPCQDRRNARLVQGDDGGTQAKAEAASPPLASAVASPAIRPVLSSPALAFASPSPVASR